MDKTYINAKIITMDTEDPYIENGYLKTSGTRIAGIGPMNEYVPDPHAEVEDVSGKILMPGMVCSHSHFYGQLIRGMKIPWRVKNWQQMLSRLWWKVDRALDEESNYASALMGLSEGLKAGVTTFIDHHASPSVCPGSLDVLEKAVKEAGARAVLAYETSDRNGEASCQEGLNENARFIEKCAGRDENDTVRAMFGLHAYYSLSPKTLEQAKELEAPFNVGFHIHCSEDAPDVATSYKRHDMHVAAYLAEMGIMKEHSIFAHFVHTGPEEWALAKETGVTIAHNPQSNSNNAVGICPVDEMLDMGVHVALGGDGFYYDLFQELNLAMLLQKIARKSREAMGGDKLQQLAFDNPYRVVKQAFHDKCGKIKNDYQADFIMLNYEPPTPLNGQNYMGHLIDAFTGHVTDSVIAGRRVVKDGVVIGLPADAMDFCRKQAAKLETRFLES